MTDDDRKFVDACEARARTPGTSFRAGELARLMVLAEDPDAASFGSLPPNEALSGIGDVVLKLVERARA